MIYKRFITCDYFVTSEKVAGASIVIYVVEELGEKTDASVIVDEFERIPEKKSENYVFPASEFETALKKYNEIREGWKQ